MYQINKYVERKVFLIMHRCDLKVQIMDVYRQGTKIKELVCAWLRLSIFIERGEVAGCAGAGATASSSLMWLVRAHSVSSVASGCAHARLLASFGSVRFVCFDLTSPKRARCLKLKQYIV